jgi:hypothetical protein
MARSAPRLASPSDRPAVQARRRRPRRRGFHRQLQFEALEVRALLAAGDLDLTLDGDGKVTTALIADMNRSGTITGSDTTFVQPIVVGTPVSFAPALPSGLSAAPAGGPDPRLWIPTDLQAEPGQALTVPVNLTVTESAGITLSSVDLVIQFDAAKLTYNSLSLGTLLAGTSFGAPLVNASVPGLIRMTASTAGSTPLLPLGTTGSLVVLHLTVVADAPLGPSPINLRADYVDGLLFSMTSLADAQVNELVLTPPPTNAATDPVDGILTIGDVGLWHNAVDGQDVNNDGFVTPLDVLVLINYLNLHNGGVTLPPIAAPPPAYYDVNADGDCTPLDTLLVIDDLNEHGPRPVGDGEATAALQTATASLSARIEQAWAGSECDLEAGLEEELLGVIAAERVAASRRI